MIETDIFVNWLGVLGERIGKEPSEQLSALYYAECSAHLTTDQFIRGMRHVIAYHRFPTWPAAIEIIEAGNPQLPVEVQAATAWQELIKLAYGLAPNAPSWSRVTLTELEARCGRAAVRTFQAVGGSGRLANTSPEALDWMRKDFVEQYEQYLAVVEREPQPPMPVLPSGVRQLPPAHTNGTESGKLTEIPNWRAALGHRPFREAVNGDHP